MINERVVTRYLDGVGTVIDFNDLKKGDKFSLVDNGVQFIDGYGNYVWTVDGEPKKDSIGLSYVTVEEATK